MQALQDEAGTSPGTLGPVWGATGKKCVLDLNAGETHTPVQSPEGGVETVARMPFFPHCQVAVVFYETVAPVRGCTRTRGVWKTRAI